MIVMEFNKEASDHDLKVNIPPFFKLLLKKASQHDTTNKKKKFLNVLEQFSYGNILINSIQFILEGENP